MSKIIQGQDLMVFVDGKTIAYATNHTLSISTEQTDISHKDFNAEWAASSIKKFSWTASTENLVGALSSETTTNALNCGAGYGYEKLYDLMTKKTPVTVFFGTNTGSFTDYAGESTPGGWTKGDSGFTGSALITSLNITALNGENATFTAEFTGIGELTLA